MNAIPAGYKHTEGGVIPVDWLEYTLGELIEFEGGSQPDKSVFRSSWKPGYVRLIQIRDYKTDRFETYIPAKLARRFCDKTDIMIGRYGPPVFQILRGIEGAYNVALIKAKPLAAINPEYAYYFLKQDKLFGFIEKLSQRSSGQTGVDLKELRQYPLPLPPTDTEQEAIAEALSDADALIESLEQLLAKKRHLKQGAMQELLTGKKRLPGFSGDYSLRKLSDMATLSKAGLNPAATPERLFTHFSLPAFDAGAIPVVELGGYIGSNKFLVPPGAVLLSKLNPRISRIWTPSHIPDNAVCSTEFLVLIPRESISREFLAALCQSPAVCYQMELHAIGTTGSHQRIHPAQALAIEVYVPTDKSEQTAIAIAISDMDAEIAELESQLAKTRIVKQGMMQKLLTGEIRLI